METTKERNKEIMGNKGGETDRPTARDSDRLTVTDRQLETETD